MIRRCHILANGSLNCLLHKGARPKAIIELFELLLKARVGVGDSSFQSNEGHGAGKGHLSGIDKVTDDKGSAARHALRGGDEAAALA